MKKRLISVLAALSMLASGIVPVMAEDTITVGGELLYSQDFEGDVEAEMLTNINGTGSSAATFTVVNDDGDKALLIDGNGKYGYNYFGAEYDNAVVKMDFKQTAASGSNGAWLGLGVRTVRQTGGAYYSNAGGYFDVIKRNEETKLYDKTAAQVRDRIGIASANGADYGNFNPFDALSEKSSGKLNTLQIFTQNDLKIAERHTKETLRMQNTISGSTVTSELKTLDGQIVDKLSAEVTPFGDRGVSQLLAHSGAYIIDDIKVMAPKTISTFFANAAEDEVMLGGETEFKLSCEDDTVLQPDIARYEYDKTAVNIDTAKGTIAPLKVGTHTVKVYLDDINSDKYLEKSFTIEGVKAEAKLEAVVENPNPAFGEGTKINVYYGGKDVTAAAEVSGAAFADGVVTPDSVGVTEVTVSYNGQNVIVPIAVNNTEETIGEQETTPVFTEDFEGDATELTALYSDNAKITVASSPDNPDNGALVFAAAGTARSLPFGPENLTDYVLEYDFYYPTGGGSSSFIGASMRSNVSQKINYTGYNVGYLPSAQAGKVTDQNLQRQLTIAYSTGSNDLSKWTYAGASNIVSQGSEMQKPWNTQKTTIQNGNVRTEVHNYNDSIYISYEATLDALNEKAGAAGYASGRNNLRAHAGYNVYFDNIKIYLINNYNDINVSVNDGKIAVAGVNADAADGALSGTVSTKAYGAADANGNYITEGNGIGYVVVTYQDAMGNKKNKVIKTGSVATGDAEEFTIVEEAMLFNGSADELDALEDGKPVFAKATLKRGALEGNGVMMAVCFYDGDTDALINVYTASADAVQRVGDDIELYTKFLLPEGAENMYARVFLWDSSMKALTEEFFEI